METFQKIHLKLKIVEEQNCESLNHFLMYFYNLEIIVFFIRFSLNSSHVLLRFGQINHIVYRKGINVLVSLTAMGL